MTAISELSARRHQAFETARDLVSDWRRTGRRTTTAGVTSALKLSGVLDLENLGLVSNSAFWDAAIATGLLEREQQPNGHWLLLLPGERLADVAVPPAPEPAAPIDPALRLKTDVWTAFVDWSPAYRRFWDREHARALLIPATPGWVPDNFDQRRFIEIEPALQSVQIDWMRKFSEKLNEPDRSALIASLADHAPRGAFKRELVGRGLSRAWSGTLRRHVLEEALRWARESHIETYTIVDNRPQTEPADLAAPSSTPTLALPDSKKSQDSEPSTSQPAAAATTTEALDALLAPDSRPRRLALLRQRMHTAIESMDFEELSGIPIRAEHLLTV